MKTKSINAKTPRGKVAKILKAVAPSVPIIGLLCAFALNSSAQTPVLFPLSQMFGGNTYAKNFTLQAAQPFITNGTNAWLGTSLTTNAPGGTSLTVLLTPNTYLITFSDATYPWRIAVPNTTNLQNALNLSTGPLPTFLVQPYVPLVAGPGVIITNVGGTNVASADTNFLRTVFPGAPTNTLKQGTWFNFYTFQAGAGANGNQFLNGMWLMSSQATPTNSYNLTSWTPFWQDTSASNVTVRDTYVLKYTDNNGKTTYILSYTTHYGAATTSGTPGPGVAVSCDGINFTLLGYVNLSTNYFAQWSPKYCINATNGLVAIIGLGSGVPNSYPTNAFVYDVNQTNLLEWSNPRVISITTHYNGEQSAGMIIYTNGLYYYFSSGGEEFTNTGLSTIGWGPLNVYPRQPQSYLPPGPTVFYFNGLWYWFATDGGIFYTTSADLITWSPNVFDGSDQPNNISMPGSPQEGAIIPETYAATAPAPMSFVYATNSVAAVGDTNILGSDSNGVQRSISISTFLRTGPGLNSSEVVVTNTVGPHGWTNFYGNGVLTNKTPW